ncbi:histidine phosphatase family protein [candidate division KSB1 bacterium]|nr:histidine phosphatase family protein [candidate division KSB1 bacterium]
MKIYLIRHGIAALRETWEKPDGERPLTDKGRRRTEQVAAALCRLGVAFTHLYTSPLVRARQTAEIIRKKSKIHKLEETALLQDDAEPDALLSLLNQHKDNAVLGLLALLVSGEQSPFTTFKKAGVALVEGGLPVQAGGCTLRWLLEPRILLEIAQGKA